MSPITAKDITGERMLNIVGHPGDGQVHEWWGDIEPATLVAATLNEYGWPDLCEALQACSEALAFARDMLGMSGEGDGKDRKADADDTIGSLSTLQAARAALAKAEGAKP